MTVAVLAVSFLLGARACDAESCLPDKLVHARRIYAPLPPLCDLFPTCAYIGPPTLELSVNREGRVTEANFLKGSGCKQADERLRACLQHWRYDAATCHAKPITDCLTLTIHWHPEKVGDTGKEPCQPPGDGKDLSASAPRPIEAQELITRMLQCSLAHSPQCWELLEEIQATRPSEPATRLAAALLEEWSVPPTDAALTRPRLVWASWPTEEEIREMLPEQIQWSVIAVTGAVRPDGRVADAKLLRGSSHELLDDRVLLAFAQAQYRPARAGNRFVERRADYLYRLEPR